MLRNLQKSHSPVPATSLLFLWVEHKGPKCSEPWDWWQMQAIGSHCVTRTPNSRITASLNKRQRAEIHHQLNWKRKKQGLSLAIKRLISHVGTSNALGVTHGIRSPRRVDALSQQRKEDNKSWKTLPHGCAKATWESQFVD